MISNYPHSGKEGGSEYKIALEETAVCDAALTLRHITTI